MNSLMWTATTRAQHMRDGLRFASDLTDAEWAVLEPLLPAPAGIGRPAEWPMREIVNAIFYVLRGGIAWRMLPACFPPRQTRGSGYPPDRACTERSSFRSAAP